MQSHKIELTLDGKLAEIVQTEISSGDYASADEAVAEALALWHLDRSSEADELVRLRAEIDASLADPKSDLTIDEVRAHFAARRRSDEAA